jgi:hypothetical protein
MTEEGLKKKVFKFKAELQPDVMKLLLNHVSFEKCVLKTTCPVGHRGMDTYCILTDPSYKGKRLSREELEKLMRKVPDGHRMLQTLVEKGCEIPEDNLFWIREDSFFDSDMEGL